MSNTAKHTPGPWDLRESDLDNRVRVFGSDDCPIVSFGPRKNWDDIDEGNARLIAAAPELLEALKRLMSAVEAGNSEAVNVPEIWNFVKDGARTAISKAEGK